MNTKLILNLNKEVLKQAKNYAKDNKLSLSKLIENYLGSLSKSSGDKPKISPLVESLTGVIPNGDYNLKEDYKNYLLEKYFI
jgi:hypothetical protein